MIKNDEWILGWGKSYCEPFNFEHINPASYDVTLSDSWVMYDRAGDDEHIILDSMTLYPGEVVLACTQEYIKMPQNVAGDLKLKSTIGRQWINHSLSGWIDPGFEGQLTLELQNIGRVPRTLRKGDRIAQIVFNEMRREPLIPYGSKGHYQGQKGATKAWKD